MNPTRRHLLALTGGVIATGLLLAPVRVEAETEYVKPDDPLAVALGYVEDAANVDRAKHKNFQDGQNCANCRFVTGEGDEAGVPCQLFQNKYVTRKGWCASWAAKPA